MRHTRTSWAGPIFGLLALSLLLPACRATMNLFPAGQQWYPGTDGAFAPAANTTVDLSIAPTGTWDQDNTANAGKGVYDPVKWAVVFKYSSVNIPSGVSITFNNHPANPPVVWLVDGDVTISGVVALNGQNGSNNSTVLIPAGPGGFRGGSGTTNCAGLGPGGASLVKNGLGNYASEQSGALGRNYGNQAIVPLIGGSGGSWWDNWGTLVGGGGGGGAILIACSGTITLNGRVEAYGGSSNGRFGSGGAVRLVSETLAGASSGNLYALGAGDGRIRIECSSGTYAGASNPQPSYSVPSDPPVIWPTDDHPDIQITKVGTRDVPADPRASVSFPNQDIGLQTTAPVTVTLAGKNIPADWTAYVRVVPRSGADTIVNATRDGDIGNISTWSATITLPQGFCILQPRAVKP